MLHVADGCDQIIGILSSIIPLEVLNVRDVEMETDVRWRCGEVYFLFPLGDIAIPNQYCALTVQICILTVRSRLLIICHVAHYRHLHIRC